MSNAWLTADEFAAETRVPVRLVRDWFAAGVIRAACLPDRVGSLRIPRSELDRILAVSAPVLRLPGASRRTRDAARRDGGAR